MRDAVGWAKRSVPTISQLDWLIDGGHVASLLCPPYGILA